jgi:hypothetical protein
MGVGKQALGIGVGAISGGITQAIGQGLSGNYDKGMMDYQSQLQMQNNKQLSDLAFKQWNRTNYKAQVEHMKKAGLNVGLMSGGGGQPGQTTTPTQNVSRGVPGNFMGIGLDAARLQSEIDVNKASAEKLKAEADSTRGGEGTIGAAQIGKALEEANTERERGILTRLQQGIAKAEEKLKGAQKMNVDADTKLKGQQTASEVQKTLINKHEATLNKLGIQKDDNMIFRLIGKIAAESGISISEFMDAINDTVNISKGDIIDSRPKKN